MTRVPDQMAFFREGLQRYADANETVKYFQESVFDTMARAFEAKTDWKLFVPTLTAGRLEIKKVPPGRVYLTAYIPGAVPTRNMEKAWAHLGLYWDPPLVGNGAAVVTAAHFSDESGKMLGLDHRSRSSMLTVGPLYNKKERHLIMPATPDFDPDVAFRQLLDAADEALASRSTSVPAEAN